MRSRGTTPLLVLLVAARVGSLVVEFVAGPAMITDAVARFPEVESLRGPGLAFLIGFASAVQLGAVLGLRMRFLHARNRLGAPARWQLAYAALAVLIGALAVSAVAVLASQGIGSPLSLGLLLVAAASVLTAVGLASAALTNRAGSRPVALRS